MKKLIHLSYTPLDGRNGGSQRALNIVKKLEKMYEVTTISFVIDDSADTHYKDFTFYINQKDFEMFCGGQYQFEYSFIMQNRSLMKQLISIMSSYKDDVILMSGLNSFPLVKYLIESNFFKGKLILDSHGKADPTNPKLIEAEQYIKQTASCVLSVNHLDHAVYAEKSKIFQCASNKIEYYPNVYWKEKVSTDFTNYVFVGSNNPVNKESINRFLPLVPNNIKIWLVGSICDCIDDDSNVNKLGFLPEEDLINLIQYADGIVLPIVVSDGGSNLKTAEAIVSKKAAIGTKEAFIGYEDFINSAGVFCFNDVEEMVEELKSPHEKNYDRDVHSLLWDYALKDLCSYVHESLR